jgi:hypothetical protein
MQIYLAPQGTPEWLAARAGCITGSMVSVARDKLKKTGEPTAAALNYAFRLAVERISGQPLDEGFQTWQMKRGHELEPEAREAFERHTGLTVRPAGFITTDDGLFGASADGLVGEHEGCEFKCLVSPESLREVLLTNDIGDYMDQCMTGMWITGRSVWHLGVYCPALAPAGRAFTHWRIERNEAYIDAMEADLLAFNKLVESYVATLTRANRQQPAALIAA